MGRENFLAYCKTHSHLLEGGECDRHIWLVEHVRKNLGLIGLADTELALPEVFLNERGQIERRMDIVAFPHGKVVLGEVKTGDEPRVKHKGRIAYTGRIIMDRFDIGKVELFYLKAFGPKLAYLLTSEMLKDRRTKLLWKRSTIELPEAYKHVYRMSHS